MKPSIDIPIISFCIVYWLCGINVATVVMMIVSSAELLLQWRIGVLEIDFRSFVSTGAVLLLGVITLLTKNAIFIQWNLTISYWIIALVFFAQQLAIDKVFGKNIFCLAALKTDIVLRRFNLHWVGFYTFLGAVNLYVVYHYTLNTWVKFQFFGVMGLGLMFIMCIAHLYAQSIHD
jgi:intracellular septation protein